MRDLWLTVDIASHMKTRQQTLVLVFAKNWSIKKITYRLSKTLLLKISLHTRRNRFYYYAYL